MGSTATPIVSIPMLGTLIGSCADDGRLTTRFDLAAKAPTTSIVVTTAPGARVRGTTTARSLTSPTGQAAAISQTWQLAPISSATIQVATITVTAQPAPAAFGGKGCVVAAAHTDRHDAPPMMQQQSACISRRVVAIPGRFNDPQRAPRGSATSGSDATGEGVMPRCGRRAKLRNVPDRKLPMSPRSTASLEVGDLIAVPLPSGRWGCLQVTDLKRTGAGARKAFIAGLLPWVGTDPPTSQMVGGLAAREQALTRIELFTQGGLEVVDTADVTPSGLPSNFRDFEVGTTTAVWGWKTAIARVASLDV